MRSRAKGAPFLNALPLPERHRLYPHLKVARKLIRASPYSAYGGVVIISALKSSLIEVYMSLVSEPLTSAFRPTGAITRDGMICEAAYFRSQKRQPCHGRECEDWLAAEKQIDRMLTGYA